jgi:hypothetical protein
VADQSITCPSCGKKIPLTRALRADIEMSLRREFDETLAERDRGLRREYDRRLEEIRESAEHEAAAAAQKKLGHKLATLEDQVKDQARALDEAREQELGLRKRERELARQKADLELTVQRTLDAERAALIADARERAVEEHRLKDAEKERQLAAMRRQIDELKRKAEQGSQQLQGEAGEDQIETILRARFPMDDITAIGQGVRGADIHQTVVDPRGARCGAILWECKNAKHWSDSWIGKLKEDQRTYRAEMAVLVTTALPKDCTRFTMIDGVLVTDFASAGALASILRTSLLQLAQARLAASTKEEKLELLYRYLSGVEFQQRVEAVVDAFTAMRRDLDAERRAAERQWARRAKQIDAVTFNIAGMYGDLQGMVALPPIRSLELPEPEAV